MPLDTPNCIKCGTKKLNLLRYWFSRKWHFIQNYPATVKIDKQKPLSQKLIKKGNIKPYESHFRVR